MRLRSRTQSVVSGSVLTPWHYLDKGATVDGVALMFRAGPIVNISAWTRLAVVIDENALKNVKMFIKLVVLNLVHAIPRIPLDEHGQLPTPRVLAQYLAPRAGSEFLPFNSLAVGIAYESPIVASFHISSCSE